MATATTSSRHLTGARVGSPEDVSPGPVQTHLDLGTEVHNSRRSLTETAAQEETSSGAGCPSGTRTTSRHSSAMLAVAAFHNAFDLPRQSLPNVDVDAELARLRVDLLVEEVGEFAEATQRGDIVAMADALGDIVYVAYGAAVTYGIDLDAVLAEIHRANMSKLDADGRPVLRKDGKVLKSSRYTSPDVAQVLARQLELPLVHDALR